MSKTQELKPVKAPDEYVVYHHTDYTPFHSRSFTSIDVLPFLIGKKWDNVALAYVHALRPSYVRVTKGMVTADAHTWRVTVCINNETDMTIESIRQEVEVGLPPNVAHGGALGLALKYGIESEECQWHNDDQIDGYICMPGEYYKTRKTEPRMVPFPKRGTETE